MSAVSDPIQDFKLLAALSVMGLITLGLVYFRGLLKRDVFDDVPARHAGLRPEDLLIGFLLILAGSYMTYFLLYAAGVDIPPTNEGERVAVVSPLSLKVAVLLALLVAGQLPVVAYVLIEARRRCGSIAWREFGVASGNLRRDIFIGLAGFLAAMWLTSGVSSIMQISLSLFDVSTPTIGHDALGALAADPKPEHVLRFAVSVVIFAPLFEEVIYRGLVQTTLVEWFGANRRWMIITVAAAFFASMHFASASWQALPALFCLAMVLGWVYERTGSLLPCFIIHAGFNLVNVALVLQLGPAA